MVALLIGFVAAAGIVVVAGVSLTRSGDELGDRLHLGGTWVGLVVLSAVTSLPELVSSLGSAVWQGQPDLACGNLFGSNSFNVFIIPLLDFCFIEGALSLRFGVLPVFSAGLGILMTSIGALAIAAGQGSVSATPPLPDWVWSLIIIGGYTGSMTLVYRFEKREFRKLNNLEKESPTVEATVVGESSWGPLLRRLGISSFLVVAMGLCMVYLADELAEYEFSFGKLGHTFVGTLGLALATSLPELVVGMTALRMGKFQMAVGNIFGSNIFNIVILAFCQLAYAPFYEQPFYPSISPTNLLAAFLAVALSGVAIAGLMYQGRRTFLRMGWDTLTIFLMFVGGMYLLFLVRG